MSADATLARVASRQHGLLTRAQLTEVGFDHRVVARRVARGQWVKLHGNVLRIAGTPVTWESQVLAQVLAAGPDAIASHRSAAVLWGLEGIGRGAPELTVPFARRSYRSKAARVHYSRDLDRVRAARRGGIACTGIDRTLLDLGAVLPEHVVLLAIDNARRRRLTDWDSLLDTLVAHARRGRDGVGRLRAILDRHFDETAVSDSAFERLVLTLLFQAGVPRPELQHEVIVGDRRYRLDLAYPASKVAIELDGSIHLERHVWEADHARQNALMLLGWTVLRFTWRDYTSAPHRIIREIRDALDGPKRSHEPTGFGTHP